MKARLSRSRLAGEPEFRDTKAARSPGSLGFIFFFRDGEFRALYNRFRRAIFYREVGTRERSPSPPGRSRSAAAGVGGAHGSSPVTVAEGWGLQRAVCGGDLAELTIKLEALQVKSSPCTVR